MGNNDQLNLFGNSDFLFLVSGENRILGCSVQALAHEVNGGELPPRSAAC